MTSFAMLSQKDIISLIDLQAPHSAIGVYTCLLSYALDGDSCFPSIASICKWLKNAISKRSVYRALNWLVENDYEFLPQQKLAAIQVFRVLRVVDFG